MVRREEAISAEDEGNTGDGRWEKTAAKRGIGKLGIEKRENGCGMLRPRRKRRGALSICQPDPLEITYSLSVIKQSHLGV